MFSSPTLFQTGNHLEAPPPPDTYRPTDTASAIVRGFLGHTLPPPSIGSARSFLTRERGSKTPRHPQTRGTTARGAAGTRLGNHEPDLRGNVLGGGGEGVAGRMRDRGDDVSVHLFWGLLVRAGEGLVDMFRGCICRFGFYGDEVGS